MQVPTTVTDGMPADCTYLYWHCIAAHKCLQLHRAQVLAIVPLHRTKRGGNGRIITKYVYNT